VSVSAGRLRLRFPFLKSLEAPAVSGPIQQSMTVTDRLLRERRTYRREGQNHD
jgi:hypothetical protein